MTQLDLLNEPGWRYQAREGREAAAPALEHGPSQDETAEAGPGPLPLVDRWSDHYVSEGANTA